ncbi:MAG: type 4a pilus biogenesis protein PilO [Phycisphaerae bacterium]|jgi:Tfp pilus assembly protein PilO|nr:type 4a pilus biogenesis protein PilO [Phycisphaerae bacterium]MCZ2398313.1 type 4a pilus biogenesis protein PilO [Phycisphaerae bacterium]
MILMRRPLLVFDVDAVGLAGALLLGGLAAWVAAEPLVHHAPAMRQAQAELQRAEPTRRRLAQQLQDTHEDVERLRRAVEALEAETPKADAVAGFVQQIARTAAAHRLELLNVTPGPIQAEGQRRLACDIVVDGRGHSLDFVAFLDDLARTNPYHALHAFSISRAVTPDSAACRLQWTLRLYMLAAQPS